MKISEMIGALACIITQEGDKEYGNFIITEKEKGYVEITELPSYN